MQVAAGRYYAVLLKSDGAAGDPGARRRPGLRDLSRWRSLRTPAQERWHCRGTPAPVEDLIYTPVADRGPYRPAQEHGRGTLALVEDLS